MSTTQVAFSTDANIKTLVNQKLKANWFTLKWFLNYCMKSYIDGWIDFGIITKNIDTDSRYYDHSWFVDVDEDIDTFLSKVRSIK